MGKTPIAEPLFGATHKELNVYISSVFRPAIALVAIALIADCSGGGSVGGGGSHGGSAPIVPTTGGRSLHAKDFGACSPCNEYPDGAIAVADENGGTIKLYDGPISSSSTASATISPSFGSYTSGLTFDPSGNLWVTYSNGLAGGIVEYAAPITTGESPSVTITGSNTGLIAPSGISYNQSISSILVADEGANAVFEWSASTSGNVAPSTTISGSNTTFGTGPYKIKSNAQNIYVSGGGAGIRQFPIYASGNVSPSATIDSSDNIADFDFDVTGNAWFPHTSYIYGYFYPGNWSTGGSVVGGNGNAFVVDDNGYMYGFQTSGTLHIYGYTSSTALVTLTGLGSDVTAAAMYSPGRLNGVGPQ
jgi:hypothetical protein